jgi:hypothetical protein
MVARSREARAPRPSACSCHDPIAGKLERAPVVLVSPQIAPLAVGVGDPRGAELDPRKRLASAPASAPVPVPTSDGTGRRADDTSSSVEEAMDLRRSVGQIGVS